MPASAFQSIRTPSLRRLKTAFSPSASPTSSPTPSRSSSTVRSPPSNRSSMSRAPSSSVSSVSSLRALILVRRKPSTVEFEMEEERRHFGAELDMLEPRPIAPWGREPGLFGSVDSVPVPGIFEVLDGRV